MDPLDGVFAAMRVQSAVYARVEASPPWGIDFAGGAMARFGLVVQGQCWLTPEGEAPVPLSAGDCYVLVHGTRYRLQDDPRSPAQSCSETVRDHIGGVVAVGGGGQPTASVVTGWFNFDALSARPLMELMPAVLHARIDQDRTRILQATLQLLNLEIEQSGLGSRLVISRLADIVFVQAIRAHAASGAEAGWLAALSDRRIGAALRAMHADPAQNWTVDRLAALAAMSRSAFAQYFRARVGEPPLAYLTRWRMFRAGCLLRQSDEAIGEIAVRVGYESEAAFNKAFKRAAGITPGLYRRTEAGVPPPLRAEVAIGGMP